MATIVWNNVDILADELEFSGYSNEVALEAQAEMLDESIFDIETRKFKPGLLAVSLTATGFWDAADGDTSADKILWDNIGQETPIVTLGPDGLDTAGNIAYTIQMAQSQYSLGAAVGELLKFDFTAQSRFRPARATVALPHVSRASTATSDKYELGALSETQQLVATLHVTAFDGTSLDVSVRSDADGTGGGETSQGSFTQMTDVGAQQIIIEGPITDTFWDTVATFVGTSFSACVVFGITPLP